MSAKNQSPATPACESRTFKAYPEACYGGVVVESLDRGSLQLWRLRWSAGPGDRVITAASHVRWRYPNNALASSAIASDWALHSVPDTCSATQSNVGRLERFCWICRVRALNELFRRRRPITVFLTPVSSRRRAGVTLLPIVRKAKWRDTGIVSLHAFPKLPGTEIPSEGVLMTPKRDNDKRWGYPKERKR